MIRSLIPCSNEKARFAAGFSRFGDLLLDARHIRQGMRNPLVAIDAGLLAFRQLGRVGVGRALALAREIHRFELVAVAAFQRVVGLEAAPLVVGQLQAVRFEFFARIDGAEDLAPHFLGRLHLARHFAGPFVRHMAVRALGAHTAAVAEVNGALQLRINVVAHFVAAGAELLGIGRFHRRVEAAPEQDARNEGNDHHEAQAQVHGRAAQDAPVSFG